MFDSVKLIESGNSAIVDFTELFDYRKLVQEEVTAYDNIDVTENLTEGGIHAFDAWASWFSYLKNDVWNTELTKEVVSFANTLDNPRILSLGSGYGGVDLDIAKLLKKPFEMLATDLNPNIYRKAEERARQSGLNIHFQAVDLNFIKLKENSFDIIFAHASLHHIINLENLFYEIHKGLRDNGRLIVLDIIGQTQVLFWKENVDFVRNIVRQMPLKYKRGIKNLDNIVPPYVTSVRQIGMEGIRQEEIEQQLVRFFSPIFMHKYGSFMRMICTNPILAPSFNMSDIEDVNFLKSLFELDVKMVKDNVLRPTEMLGVFVKREQPSLQTIIEHGTQILDEFKRRIVEQNKIVYRLKIILQSIVLKLTRLKFILFR